MVFNLDIQDALASNLVHHFGSVGGVTRPRVASAFAVADLLGKSPAPGEVIENDPKDPSTWTNEYKLNSPQVQQVTQQMQENIDKTQAAWHKAYVRFDDSYGGVNFWNNARMADWDKHKNKLSKVCETMRDGLNRLNAAKAMCEQMQDQELPTLFKVKGAEPKRFERFGEIQGCVRQDWETGKFEPKPCECIAGNELTGCADSVGKTGNTLSCSHILEEELPNLPMADFFKEGGACRISSADPWNSPIIPKNGLEQGGPTTEATISPVLTGGLSLLPQCVSIHQRSAIYPRRGATFDKASSKASRWGAFLVSVDQQTWQ